MSSARTIVPPVSEDLVGGTMTVATSFCSSSFVVALEAPATLKVFPRRGAKRITVTGVRFVVSYSLQREEQEKKDEGAEEEGEEGEGEKAGVGEKARVASEKTQNKSEREEDNEEGVLRGLGGGLGIGGGSRDLLHSRRYDLSLDLCLPLSPFLSLSFADSFG